MAGTSSLARSMKHRRVLLDASVLYTEPVRGLLLWIAALGGFDPLWTARILDEVGRNCQGPGIWVDGHIYCIGAIVMVMAVVSVPSVPVSDAARRLGVSEQRVRAMISAGKMDAEKAAGAWWIPAQSLARVAAAGSCGGRPFGVVSAWA